MAFLTEKYNRRSTLWWAAGIVVLPLGLGAFLGCLNIAPAYGLDGPLWATLRTGLTIVVIATIYALWRSLKGVSTAFGIGLLFGIGYFGVALHWLGSSANPNPATFIPRELLLTFGALCLFFPWWSLWFGLAKAMALGTSDNSIQLLAFCFSFGIANLLLGDFLFGMPMAPLALVVLDTSLMSLLPLIGQFGVDAVLVLIGTLMVGWVHRTFACLTLIVCILSFGPQNTIEPETVAGQRVYLAQPSLPHPSMMPYGQSTDIIHSEIIRQVKLGVQAHADLIVLPENAVLADLTEDTKLVEYIASLLPPSVNVVIGFGRVEATGEMGSDFLVTPFNSAMFITSTGAQRVVDKAHLVPFGETMPQIFFDLGFETVAGPSGGYGNASNISVVDIAQNSEMPEFAILICYEAMLSGPVSRETSGATWLLNMSSEALFRGTVGPRLLIDHVRVRTLETGLPMLRSTAHAFSGVISPTGKLISVMGEEENGGVIAEIPKAVQTVFRSTGYLPYFAYLLLLFVAWIVMRLRNINSALPRSVKSL